MNALKQYFSDMPEAIIVPKGFVHKKCEVIFIVEDSPKEVSEKTLKDFFGAIPDFPERTSQGNYEERNIL